MGLQAAVHLGYMPWALTKEEKEAAAACTCYYKVVRQVDGMKKLY
jgi:hypothetical protein